MSESDVAVARKSRAAKLADALLADRAERKAAAAPKANATCFKCGKLYVCRGPRGDDSGAFCSDECRIEYDCPGAFTFDPFNVTRWRVVAGGDPVYLVATPMTRVSGHKDADGEYRGGWRIECPGCSKRFESLGLRYGSPGCGKRHREQQEARTVMAEVGMTASADRRPCQRCGGPIPKWRNGRAVRKDAQLCGRC